jgi:hypothetical protein
MAGLLARILPYYVSSDVVPRIMSREEVEAKFKERGLPMDLLKHLQAAPSRLDDDEDADPYRPKIDATG